MPAPTVVKLNFCRDRRPRLSVSYEKTAPLFISETVVSHPILFRLYHMA